MWDVDSGWPKELCIGWESRSPHGKEHFWGGWRRDFPACCQAPFPVALPSGFLHVLLTSVLIGRLQKQSSVKLNFPDETPLCDAASCQNPLTTFLTWCLAVVSGINLWHKMLKNIWHYSISAVISFVTSKYILLLLQSYIFWLLFPCTSVGACHYEDFVGAKSHCLHGLAGGN